MNEGPLIGEISVSNVSIQPRILYSEYLERSVVIDIYLPAGILSQDDPDLLLINDGQDLVSVNFGNLVNKLITSGNITPFMSVGIHCGPDRLNEYGTICRADY